MSHHAHTALADAVLSAARDERALDAFDYPRDWARIADSPAPVRDQARLLVYDRRTGRVDHRVFRDLPDVCAPGDAIVVNDSRVIPARLYATKIPTGGRIEVLLVRRLGEGVWSVLLKGGARPGQRLAFEGDGRGEVLEPDLAGRPRLRLVPDDASWLERVGHVPLPPYLRRGADVDVAWHGGGGEHVDDRERYQTVFAKTDGSVAAPTAGLHFTRAVLDRLDDRGVATETVTLHVGPGTFEPVRTPMIDDHAMAAEWGEVTTDTADRLNAVAERGGRLLAVGTTATRLLETAAADDGRIRPWRDDATLFIRPGYRWKAVGALLTNFHLPRSTPLLLASAFCGRSVLLDLYREAARERYRFYSYGDAMLII